MLENIDFQNILFLDIETVPGASNLQQLSLYEQELWHEKRGKLKPEDKTNDDYYFQQAGIFAEFGRIICISAGYFKDST